MNDAIELQFILLSLVFFLSKPTEAGKLRPEIEKKGASETAALRMNRDERN